MVVTLFGCSADMKMGDTATLDLAESSPFDTSSSEVSDADSVTESVAWWTLGATFGVESGSIDVASSHVVVTLRSDSLKTLCEEHVAIIEMDEVDSPHKSVFGWWRLTWEDLEETCPEAQDALPKSVHLGVGNTHPDVMAGLSMMELANTGFVGGMNGAYASLDEDKTLLAFGVAAPQSVFSGEVAAPLEGLPLSDGVWQIAPIYTFEYSP